MFHTATCRFRIGVDELNMGYSSIMDSWDAGFLGRLRRLASRYSRWLGMRGAAPSSDHQTSPGSATDFALSVEYLAQHHAIKVTAKGTLTLEHNNQLVAAALAASYRYGTNRILVDDRDIELDMNFTNIYDLPENNQKLGVHRALRVALIFRPSTETARVFKFYEDCSYIRDFQHRVFVDEEEALQWLTATANPGRF